ncbi:hypothetical protein IAT38_004923 [Cryptococcus sp. DSM 104549]
MSTILETLMQQGPGQFSTEPKHPTSLTPLPLSINPLHLVHPEEPPITKYIYSGFLEHLGRCIYGGIVDDPKNPSPEALLEKQEDGTAVTQGRAGWRKDVMKVLGSEGELKVPMLRWPGVKDRPKRLELAWLSDESNQFGTDEFVDYCRATKCEPYICLNMGTGTYEEALAWLEYCNGTGNTHWANLRRRNTGRDEPHAVKYWGLGNEMWGPWQVGNLSATDYAKKAKRWAHGLKLVDPSVKLVSCGETGSSDWDREVLQTLVASVDLHSIHFYTMLGHDKQSNVPGLEYEKNVFGPAAPERDIEICKCLIDLANIGRTWQGIPARDIKIAYDEWNVWDESKAPGSGGLEQHYTYTDMLGFCAWLNVLVRKHKDIGLACLAQSVNVISPVMTRPDGILYQTTYYPLRLFSNYMKDGRLLQLPAMREVYEGPSFPVWVQQGRLKPKYIDTVAILAGDSIRVSVLNRHPTLDWDAEFKFAGYNVKSVEVHEVYSDNLEATNTFDEPENVVPAVSTLDQRAWEKRGSKWTVRKHSWVFFIFDGTMP